MQALADNEDDSRQAASEALVSISAHRLPHSKMEASLVMGRNLGYWVPGTTTAQSPGLPRNPVFEVRGAAHTTYLRTATGDIYENGQWRQLDPVDLRYDSPGGPARSGRLSHRHNRKGPSRRLRL